MFLIPYHCLRYICMVVACTSIYIKGQRQFAGVKPYLHFYYNYSTIYLYFNYKCTGGANADNYTVSGMGFENIRL